MIQPTANKDVTVDLNKSAKNNSSQLWHTEMSAKKNKSPFMKPKPSPKIAKNKLKLNVDLQNNNVVKLKKNIVAEQIKNNTNVEPKPKLFKKDSNGKTSLFAMNISMNNAELKKENSSLTMNKPTHMNVNNKNNINALVNLKPDKFVSTKMSGPVTQ